MRSSDLEAAMLGSLRLNQLPAPVPEYRFAQTLKRGWRFDFAYPEAKVAIEVEGGIYIQGRHTRGQAFERDCEKYNTATLMGWSVLRFTKHMIEDNRAADTVRAMLLLRGAI